MKVINPTLSHGNRSLVYICLITVSSICTLCLMQVVTVYGATDLRISANGHHLEKSDGTPFLLLSDTEWLLNVHSDDQIKTILDSRAAQGFTAVQVFATHAWSSDNRKDYNGNLPFLNNNPTQLSAPYWNRWRWICDEAAARGLHFILVMGEPGLTGDVNVPWRVNNNEQAYEYARQVGTFFATASNVIFALGQDSQANGSIMPGSGTCLDANGWRAMAEGVADGVNGTSSYDNRADYTTTMMTYHGLEKHPGGYTDDISQYFQNDAWIDFYGPEVWHDNDYCYEIVNRDYNLGVPVKPSFIMEGTYETEPFRGDTSIPTPPSYVRIEAWHSLLGGICGYTYGHCKNWQQTASTDYINTPGARQMTQMASFANKHHWWLWKPDNIMITANAGSGAKRKVGVLSITGDECIVYFPTNSNATIRNILTSSVTATWFDPRNGNTINAESFTPSMEQSMIPPVGWEDAVLVLTVAGGASSAPGLLPSTSSSKETVKLTTRK